MSLPRRIPFWALLAAAALAVFTLTRLALALDAGLTKAPLGGWPFAFGMGLWFDLATLCFLVPPFLIYDAVAPARWRHARWHIVVRAVVFGAALFALLFGAVAELLFWQEFTTRFNFIAVDYLIYTREVIGNIEESYPVAVIVFVIGAIAAAAVWRLRGAVARADAAPMTWRRRAAKAAAAVLLPLLAWGLADVDQMYRSDDATIEELAGNGLFTFAAAMRRNELDYDRFYLTMPQAQADAILAGLGVERAAFELGADADDVPDESDEPKPPWIIKRPRNVVLVSIESLSASFVGAYGAKGGLTPVLDRLAAEGLLFTHTFATGTRTVRGLEALSLGTPPVPGQAIVRRPNNEHLETLGGILRHQGYASSFIYGGYGYFDNMNAYFGDNDYTVLDRVGFPKESIAFENVWGVADESLYDNALRQIDADHASGKPFFAQIMTTSNHRPFTYTDGRIDIPSPGGRKGAVKYTDWAIGHFVEEARKRPWFGDTLFVFVADHCASVAGKTELPVDKYLIPLILWAPGIVAPGRNDQPISQIDIPPTVLDVLGASGDDFFFGRAAAERAPGETRVFISNYQSLGYYKGDQLVVLKPGRRIESFRVDPTSYETTPTPLDPVLRDEAIAYYQTAARSFSHGRLLEPWYKDR
jgi:phosphoglycerol transferase MdoB-like AlkP superfamily enzyme